MNNSNKTSQLSSVNSANDLIDAKLEEHQLCGFKHCPGCGHKLEGSTPDWVGLPAGVKFDPTDQELIEHLQAKVEGKSSNSSHPLIDEFIPTIDGEDGICYSHPEKLPGVTRDGLSRHFFHRPSKAYTTGTRKRRKIQTECDLQGGETRWHKTGKTRPVMMNGKQKGCKKILVLYTNFGKNRKPEKTNWVMHQYHLGQHEEEKEGELVVSKIFYQTQPRQCNWTSERTATTGDGSEPSGRRESGSGSGSTSSSKEVITLHNRDDQLSISAGIVGSAAAAAAALSSYNSRLDMQHFRTTAEHFSFVPFSRKAFDEAQAGIGDASTIRDTAAMSAACDEHEPRPQHQHQHQHHLHHPHPHHAMATPQDQHQHQHHHHHTHHSIESTAAFHINRPSHPISQIISPPPLHHASIILDDDSFQNVSRIMLQNQNFHHQQQQQQQQEQQQQQTQQQQHHHKLGGRSAAGLEEIIMGCTSSSSPGGGVKEESSLTNPPVEADWMKYSTFWHDTDHSDHHG